MYNQNIPHNHQWYFNDAKKQDISLFVRSEFSFTATLTAFADLQYRFIDYRLQGPDKDFAPLDHQTQYQFLNPKAGLTWRFLSHHLLTFGISAGNKEPSRSDFKEAIKAGRPDDLRPEQMLDYEFGYRYRHSKAQVELTLYYMDYKDQLVPTGKLTETGYVVKENVASSFRAGIEIAAGWQPLSSFRLSGNLCLSRNRIQEYTAWVDTYDNPSYWTPLPQQQELYKDVPLAYSPQVTSALQIEAMPWRETTIALRGKYVGKQFYDNTGNDSRSLPSYWTAGLRCSQQLSFKSGQQATISLFVDNLFNRKYVDNAWVYRATFADGSHDYIETGLFPQAEINFTLSLSIKF
jgi:iron complex outermembrane receptor protein